VFRLAKGWVYKPVYFNETKMAGILGKKQINAMLTAEEERWNG
jgi:hypothetical protein